MRVRDVIAAMLLLASTVAVAQNEAADPALEAEIRRLDRAHAQAIFKGDGAALKRLMAPDLTVNHPTNRIVNETQGILDMIRDGVIRYSGFERTPENLIFFEDMVVVMGRETVVPADKAPNAGKTLQRRYTNVWMKRDGRWQLTVRHANNVCAD